MSVTQAFPFPFYTGLGSDSNLIPGQFPVGLGGRGYMLDLKNGVFRRATLPSLRAQADSSGLASEASLSREGLWRRSVETFHAGAGQNTLDREASVPARFRTSKGVDVWTPYELSLLKATDQKRSSANSNLALMPAGARLYLTDGTSVLYTSSVTPDSPTWTALTGVSATAASSITSDGYNVWTAHGSDWVYSTNTGSGAMSAYVTSGAGVSLVAFVKGRLMAAGSGANKHQVYNIIAGGAMPTALVTHPNTDFTWTAFAEGQRDIYMAGYSGDKSEIWRTRIKTDGSALDVGFHAVPGYPDGEIIRSLGSYLGYILIGTDKGMRLARADVNGDLVVGALIETTSAVSCFEGQGKYVWYGLSNYDATDTGLGRANLDESALNGTAPPYASDLMVTAQGAVTSVATFQSLRVLCVSGSGVYAETTTYVTSGTLDTGRMTFGLSEPKTLMTATVRHQPLAAGESVALGQATDQGTVTTLGTSSTLSSTGPTALFTAQNKVAQEAELRLTLTAGTGDATTPKVTYATLRGHPSVGGDEVWEVPLLIGGSLSGGVGDVFSAPAEDLDNILDLETSQAPTTFQLGTVSYTVFVSAHEFVLHSPGEPISEGWTGTCLVRLIVPKLA